jgi:ATP-dependent exoDNAse (exonuclease V) alpha subunit
MSASTDKKISEKDLSPDQLEVFEAIQDWVSSPHSDFIAPGGASSGELGFRDSQVQSGLLTVGGYAGTGKSTLLGVLAASTDLLVAYVTYTGRAASVLNRKLRASGVETTTLLRRADEDAERGLESYFDPSLKASSGPPLCTTIHRLLYRPVIDPKTEELRGWVKRSRLDRDYDLIVIDEGSMVGDEILQDLQRWGVPILAVGDHGQLPPVMASGDLMQNPDLKLEKIHRQAEKSPIIALSRHIREGGKIRDFKGHLLIPGAPEAAIDFRAKQDLPEALIDAYITSCPLSILDVGVLCWTNRTRCKLNGAARKALEYAGPPRKEEPVICLKNKPPVYNGMRGLLTEDSKLREGQPWLLDASVAFPDEGLPASPKTLCAPQFFREKTFASVEELQERGVSVYSMSSAGEMYDMGYAMTVHKSQGSQFSHVLLYVDRAENPWEEESRRYFYTAVTRASERLTILQ